METLELQQCADDPKFDPRTAASLRRSPSLARLSKIDDYLADNICMLMLSDVKARGQAESGRSADAVPNWESRAHPFHKERGKGWATA